MHPWLKTLHTALSVEERSNRETLERQLQLPAEQAVQAGVMWHPIRLMEGRPEGKRYLVTVRGRLHSGLDSGDRVSLGRNGVTGRIGMRDTTWAEILCDAEPDMNATMVHKIHDASHWIRLRQALENVDPERQSCKALLEFGDDAPPLERAWPALDAAQSHAANVALAQRIGLIHGPPGTGKTHVLAQILADAVSRGDRPWALADSNAAVDHLARTTAKQSVSVLRMGVAHRMAEDVRPHGLEAWMQRSPQSTPLAHVEKRMSRARSRRATGRELGELYRERRQLQAEARTWAMAQAEVFAVTHGSLARLVGDDRFPIPRLAVVDEATQAIEPSIWIAAQHVEQLVLVGDPHQLGPVVKGPRHPLARSVLERLLDHREAPMLEVQHRMHEDLQSLVQAVYGERYRAHPKVRSHSLFDLPPLCFVDTAGSGTEEQRDPQSRSLYNEAELELVERALERLFAVGVLPEQVAIATPYSAQVQRLHDIPLTTGTLVGSINALQGSEADVVLLTFVRSNPHGEIGFLNDVRRLTVGLTRARKHLWMVGDSATLASHPRFVDLLDQAASRGHLTSVWEDPWQLSH